MSIAIRRPNGSKISNNKYTSVRNSADLIVHKLLNLVSPGHRASEAKSLTKSAVKSLYQTKFRQALLELEAKQTLLRLCAGHWKAEAMLSQSFLWRGSDPDSKAVGHGRSMAPTAMPSSSVMAFQAPELLSISPILQPRELTNAAKRALEYSPGPKSLSASQAQKCTKDETTVSGKKASSSLVPPMNQRLPAHRLTPTFLGQAEVVEKEPAKMHTSTVSSISVDPSVDNLIAVLTSKFPSLTDAVMFLRSMNAEPSFKQGATSPNVATLLERVQFADPSSPDFDEDNLGQNWGHYQFTAGGLTLSSTLTTWQDVGSVATALKFMAAALKACLQARETCANARASTMAGFLSDVYLEKTLDHLKNCWVGAGGTILTSPHAPCIPTTPTYCDVAKSPPCKWTLKFKGQTIMDAVTAANIPSVPTGTNSTTHQLPTSGGVTRQEPSAALAEDGVDATLLKVLQVPE